MSYTQFAVCLPYFGPDNDNVVARTLWPSEMGLPGRERTNLATVPNWRKISSNYDDLCERLTIDRAGGDEYTLYMNHIGEEGPSEALVEVQLRLTGFVSAVNLSATGDWEGYDLVTHIYMQCL